MAGAAAVVGLLVGCSRDDAAPGSPSTSAAVPTASAPATPTATPSATPTPTPAPTATPTATAAPPAAPTPPPLAEPTHGGTAWGVYLAVQSSPDDPAWVQSGTRLEEMGYVASEGNLACDVEAPDALGLPPEAVVRSVHFTTRADADLFASLYGAQVLGIVEVTTLCLD
ncbi:hypothetical protein [Cellulomonas aerilata]|uniref:hypothetical protein n=1 Tax=Cellulomonas aerilata TaxID=515326 RepID=UPI0011BDE033|nr:hypothetical protein [Cellulomonas aerilata]